MNVAASARAQYLDLLKSLLIYGMITAHVTQLLTFRPSTELTGIADFVNLITFSGFMLAFGLGIGMSGERKRPLWDKVRPILMMLAASWISSLAFVVLVDRKPVNVALLTDLLSLRVLYGWSEFLASFLTLYILIAIARPVLVWLASQARILILATTLCLATTLLVTNRNYPLMATVIGTTNFASFPILPYLPWFLVGIWLGRNNRVPNLIEWAIAAIGTAGFCYVLYTRGEIPGRFPPSIWWIVGAAVPLAVYLTVSRFIVRGNKVLSLLLVPGRHVLASLLVSNLIIFGARFLYRQPLRIWWATLLAALGIIVLVTVWGFALEWWKGRSTTSAGALRRTTASSSA